MKEQGPTRGVASCQRQVVPDNVQADPEQSSSPPTAHPGEDLTGERNDTVFDLDEAEFLRAFGQELQRIRESRLKLFRPEFVKLLPGNVPVNTYACYELGTRACPLPRMVVICHALGVTVGDVTDAALTSLGINLQNAHPQGPLDRFDRALAELAVVRDQLIASSDANARANDSHATPQN